MDKQEQARKLEERLVQLSAATLLELGKDKQLPQFMKTQLGKSITSVGANYSEANNASSKADFRSKMYIAKKEAGESLYWIKVARELKQSPDAYEHSYNELNEVIRILQSAISTMENDK